MSASWAPCQTFQKGLRLKVSKLKPFEVTSYLNITEPHLAGRLGAAHMPAQPNSGDNNCTNQVKSYGSVSQIGQARLF